MGNVLQEVIGELQWHEVVKFFSSEQEANKDPVPSRPRSQQEKGPRAVPVRSTRVGL